MAVIEDRQALHNLASALNFAAKPEQWVKAELKILLTWYCEYRKNYREILESADCWDCGRQDGYFDKVDHLFTRLHALSLARKIQRGSGARFKQLSMRVLGEDI